MRTTIPTCQGWARFDTEEQAWYVARGLMAEQGGMWTVVPHSDHWHVLDITS
jgi:hypothetical protein